MKTLPRRELWRSCCTGADKQNDFHCPAKQANSKFLTGKKSERGTKNEEREMRVKLPENLHIVQNRPTTVVEKVRAGLGEAQWLNDPEAWDRAKFVEQIEQALLDSHGSTVQFDQLLVGLLVTQVELYVRCWSSIKAEGLVTTFNAGATHGRNLHIGMADNALLKGVNLLNELALTPKTRAPQRTNGKYARLLSGPD